jgi:CheY-like chemotaxis protein
MQIPALSTDLAPPQPDEEPVVLLIAAEDAGHRSQVAAAAEDAIEALMVHEAADGAEAIKVGLESQPQIALIDVDLPRLGGIEVALVLRELLPGVRLALHTSDPAAHNGSAREFCLPLFDEPASERTLRWLQRQARTSIPRERHAAVLRRPTMECSVCGYGITRSMPPERCPMCHSEDAWLYTSRRPFARA